jgi:hypothetical protein
MTLFDLDELILKVRDQLSRRYYTEAIRSYQAGAYRAAIVSTWIAVVYDIISKIRELQTQGDKAANLFITKLDKAVGDNNIPDLQAIEKDILENARNDFELLSKQEYEDFRRIKEDRHWCAHPAFNEDNALFEPTAELVRAHLRHAVLHLLQHQPVQGKSALSRIQGDIQQDSFPTEAEDAQRFLESKYLNRAKDALVRNLVSVMLKPLLRQDVPVLIGKENNAINTLLAVRSTHREIYDQVIEQQVNSLVDSLDDSKLANLLGLIGADRQIWGQLSEANKLRVESFIQSEFPAGDTVLVLRGAKVVDELREKFIEGLTGLSEERQIEIIETYPDHLFDQIAPKLYSEVPPNYRKAEEIAQKVILPMIPYFSASGIINVLEAVRNNNQIRNAAATPQIIEKLFEDRKDLLPATSDKWKEFAEWLLEDEAPDDYYSYPSLRKKLEEHGLQIDIPAREDDEVDDEALS